MMTSSLKLDVISKSFGVKSIYQNLTFSFQKGCYALVGPNGTGKTVLIEMLAGAVLQDSGSITLRGVGDNHENKYKEKLTYIPGKPTFFPGITGYDFLDFICAVKKSKANKKEFTVLIDGFKLNPHLNTKFSQMSLGTQKKLFLSTLSIGQSELVVMDEPTNALDEESCGLLFNLIKNLSKDRTVILSTHDKALLEEITPTVIELESNPISKFNQYEYRGSRVSNIL